MPKRIAVTLAALVSLALPAQASAHKAHPFLTIARAEAAIRHMAQTEGGSAISVTACRRGTPVRVACTLTEIGEYEEGLATLTERITVRLARGRLKLTGSLRERGTPPETDISS
jgi:hypothetical protein